MSPIPSTQQAVFMQAHDLSSEKVSPMPSQQHDVFAAQQVEMQMVLMQPRVLFAEEQMAHLSSNQQVGLVPAQEQLVHMPSNQQVGFVPAQEQMVHILSNQQVGFMPAQDLSNQACTGFWICPMQPVAQACAGFDPAWPVYPPSQCQIAGAQCDNMWGPAQMVCVDQWSNMYGQAPLMQQAAMLDAPVQPESYASLQGHIWRLSQDHQGCRVVQQAFSDAVSDDERIAFASEFRGHVWEAMKCPNANHVLQKFIEELRPVDSQFVIDEIQLAGIGAASRVARHRYGCRILQRLLEHCSSAPEQVHDLMEEILRDGVQLATNIFANYVLSHLLEFGTDSQKWSLTNLLAAHAASVGANSYGCAVLHKALDHGSSKARVVLAHALLVQPRLLAAMASSRHGHGAVKQALEVADMPQRKMALSALMGQRGWKNCRYGRALYNHLEKCWEQEQSA